jgi:hypothetical protein
MSSTNMRSEPATEIPRTRTVDMKLEVVVIPRDMKAAMARCRRLAVSHRIAPTSAPDAATTPYEKAHTTPTIPSGIASLLVVLIQNPKFSDVGAWGASSVSQERVGSIYSNRRFAKVACPILSKPQKDATRIKKVRCIYDREKGWHKIDDTIVGRADNVRVLQTIGSWIAVDNDEDGKLDGYCPSSNFTTSLDDMPTFL